MSPRKRTGTENGVTTDIATMHVDGNIDFESAMSKLEAVILELERDDLELETALASFEEGVQLMRVCDTHLRHARGQISQLLKGEDGDFMEKILGTSLKSFLHQENEND